MLQAVTSGYALQRYMYMQFTNALSLFSLYGYFLLLVRVGNIHEIFSNPYRICMLLSLFLYLNLHHTCTFVVNLNLYCMSSLFQGCAFLYVAKEHQDTIRPLVQSWGFNCGFSAEFAWTGIDLLSVCTLILLHNACIHESCQFACMIKIITKISSYAVFHTTTAPPLHTHIHTHTHSALYV